ncbi:outer membrane protein assembly factor BamC [Chitinilyticum piscinae]|uniref:Outer membrane protein assembly factor BamC n=1 Tax=Chitinilyticum piscinae TaxID=2866724 RepID=A0A8J7K9U4_9NEIS|nr:outer membrane protein assembly factor BamC [Chitinilyticum piscinae]MBE9608674.1 outer membrane protein assembly factor BamC [Chitinilyticum piscinae]
MRSPSKALKLLPVAAAIALTACSSDQLMLQSKVDYRSGSDNINKNPLEVPPDLTTPAGNANYTLSRSQTSAKDYVRTSQASGPQQVMPDAPKAKLERAGAQRWLVVNKSPDKVWADLREFWIGQGFLLATDNPTLGVMETDWLENRANLPPDFLTKLLNKVAGRFLSTGEMDSYRTRVEPGREPGTTEVYITHHGLVEVFRDGSTEMKGGGDSNVQGETSTIWTPRPADPDLEAQMLALALQQLGYDKDAAQKVVVNGDAAAKAREPQARVDSNGTLLLADTFDRAWRRVGLAVERSGFVVYDRNRAEGSYLIRQAELDIGKEKESSNWMSSLAFWKSTKQDTKTPPPEYTMTLTQEGSGTRVKLKPNAGTPANPALEQKLLTALQMQLK